MRFPTTMRGPATLVGALSLAAVVSVAGAVSVAHAGIKTDKATICNTSGVCHVFTNNGSGAALEADVGAANDRAFYVFATNSGADGTDINGGYIGAIVRAPAGGGTYPFVATDSNGNDLDFMDGNGDIFYHGSLNTFLQTPGGGHTIAYGANSASSTLDDVGTGHLVRGEAYVRLDPMFARSLDTQHPYHVFLTPGGDTRGLYVATRTPAGFIVRETQGGRGTLDFDYRIVGTPLGRATDRIHDAATVREPSAPILR